MTIPSTLPEFSPQELDEYGFGRAQDIAFDAVIKLWRKRQKQGVKQTDIAARIGWDPAVVSKKLQGPSNWTMRTLGALAEALDGELHILVLDGKEALPGRKNSDAYSGYEQPINPPKPVETKTSTSQPIVFGTPVGAST